VNEPLPTLTVTGVFGDQAKQSIELTKDASEQPLLVVFFHERSRQAFALTRVVMRFAATRRDTGLHPSVVFLTDDVVETDKWLNQIENLLPKEITYTISRDGIEGPGSYGLNRQVTLTVLVAKEGKVTANFALTQPQAAADGPKILRAIADVTGGGELPEISELLDTPGDMKRRPNQPPARNEGAKSNRP
jgi:hypothetical protein